MRFGRVPIGEALGAVLAHAAKLPDGRLPKGRRLRADDVARLRESGVADIVVARLDPGDLGEDEAAFRLAVAAGQGVTAGPAGTGRVNFFADGAGLFLADRDRVDALNAVDPGITLATLPDYTPVKTGQMVATVKIIPLAVPGAAVEAALGRLAGMPAFRLAPFRAQRIALVQTELAGVKRSVLDKTRRVLEQRLAPSGSVIAAERRCPHRAEDLATALAELPEADITVIFGASAVIDAADVIPAAIEASGGRVLHLGMPVDPGNLLLLGSRADKPVLGAPGCARSPKENGFDWILNRLLADLPVTSEEIRGMGVGGLLMEIPTRPEPRDRVAERAFAVDVVLLAAGRSSRMGGPHKLLAEFDGVPLVRRSAATALASRARRVQIVVGHRSEEVRGALAGLDVEIVPNEDFADGLAGSLRLGFAAALAAPEPPAGVLVMLADQPLLTASDLDRLIAAFRPEGAGSIVVATADGRRGNPVILSARYGPEIAALSGDIGARPLLAAHPDRCREIELGSAAGVDVDTPEAMAEAGGVLVS